MALDHETRELLRHSAQEWLKSEWPISKFRTQRHKNGILSVTEIWKGMTEMGWPGLCLSEDENSLSLEAISIVLRETGKNLAASPLLTTGVIATSAINLSRQNPYLTGIADKIQEHGLLASFAIDEGAHHQPSKISTLAAKHGNGWVLSGQKDFVPFTSSADLFLVVARVEEDDRLGLFFVERDTIKHSTVNQIDCIESGSIILNDVAISHDAELQSENGENLLNSVLNRALIGLSAEMLGIAESAFEMTLEYLKVREQFGQLIGSFQALQHRAAKMYAEIELTQSVIDAAVSAVDAGDPDIDAIASVTKVMANETLHLVTNEAIQLHGGIGMTDEHDAGLYIKRARVLEIMYGSTSYHKNRFAVTRGF